MRVTQGVRGDRNIGEPSGALPCVDCAYRKDEVLADRLGAAEGGEFAQVPRKSRTTRVVSRIRDPEAAVTQQPDQRVVTRLILVRRLGRDAPRSETNFEPLEKLDGHDARDGENDDAEKDRRGVERLRR